MLTYEKELGGLNSLTVDKRRRKYVNVLLRNVLCFVVFFVYLYGTASSRSVNSSERRLDIRVVTMFLLLVGRVTFVDWHERSSL